jgi:RNA polymerase sigma factor (sigma-70 family)
VTNKESANGSAEGTTKWTGLVQKIAAGDVEACAELYRELRTIQFYFGREIGSQDAEDRYHNLVVAVIEAIRRGVVRDPERVMGYARTIAQRSVVQGIGDRCFERNYETPVYELAIRDSSPDPESIAIKRENKEVASKVLAAMPPRDREVLIRFYLYEHDAKSIQQDMGLTDTQFRLIKSRAKARFTSLVQRRIRRSTTANRRMPSTREINGFRRDIALA